MIRTRCSGYYHHVRAFAPECERLVHIHVLGVTPVPDKDRIARVRTIDRRLYRRPVRIKRTTITPPASRVDIDAR